MNFSTNPWIFGKVIKVSLDLSSDNEIEFTNKVTRDDLLDKKVLFLNNSKMNFCLQILLAYRLDSEIIF